MEKERHIPGVHEWAAFVLRSYRIARTKYEDVSANEESATAPHLVFVDILKKSAGFPERIRILTP